jgi:hypothetical protein
MNITSAIWGEEIIHQYEEEGLSDGEEVPSGEEEVPGVHEEGVHHVLEEDRDVRLCLEVLGSLGEGDLSFSWDQQILHSSVFIGYLLLYHHVSSIRSAP